MPGIIQQLGGKSVQKAFDCVIEILNLALIRRGGRVGGRLVDLVKSDAKR